MSLNKGDTKKDPDVESGDKAQVRAPISYGRVTPVSRRFLMSEVPL